MSKADIVTLAQEMDKDTANTVSTLVIANEEYKRGPVALMLALVAGYGDKLSQFPIPNSETGNNPDKFKDTVISSKDNSQKQVDTTFYKELFNASPVGDKWLTRLQLLKLAKDEPESTQLPRTGDNADIYEHRHDLMWISAEKRTFEQRLLNGKNMLVKAMSCYNALTFMGEHEDVIEFGYNQDVNGNLRRGLEPVWIKDVAPGANPNSYRNLTANSLIKLSDADVWKKLTAAEGGVTFATVVALLTTKRGTKTDTGNDGVKQVVTVDKLPSVFGTILNTLDGEDENGAKRISALRKHMEKNAKDRDFWVKMVGDVIITLDPIWADIREYYDWLQGQNSGTDKKFKAAS